MRPGVAGGRDTRAARQGVRIPGAPRLAASGLKQQDEFGTALRVRLLFILQWPLLLPPQLSGVASEPIPQDF